MSNIRRVFGALLILALISVTIWLPTGPVQPAGQDDQRSAAGGAASGAPSQQEPAGDLLVSDPVEPFLTAALSDLPPAETEYWLDREINPRLHFGAQLDENYNPELGPDPLLAAQEGSAPAAPDAFGTPLLNFNGQGFSGVNPPDTIGDVGPNHYIQMINNSSSSRVTAYNKNTGAVIFGPALLSSLAPSGNPCSSGRGDPIVLHDQLANRWLLSEFAASGNNLCVYISQTADPGGSYYFYRFQTPRFPDYPKYAVWPDAYYVSTNENDGSTATPAAYALDRTRMLAGLSATFQRRTAPSLSGFGFQALTPADLDGLTAPPSGTPGLFMRHRDTEVHGPGGMPSNDLLEVWTFTVNWTTPASSSFSKIADIQVAEFDSALCGLSSFSAIPMPGVPACSVDALDPLREVIMWRLSYRNFGSRQVLVGNFSTDVGSDRAGVRWFELRRTSGNWGLFQQGTYAPGSVSRWMGGIAMDQAGNIALGYNVANSSTYPSLRYVGRLAGDAAGTMPQGEYTVVNGSAANGSNRYGDYSSMNIDPVDDCTFWFTGQWNDASQWKTRIAKFKFDQCGSTGMQRVYLPLVLRTVAPTTGAVAGWVRQASNSQAIPGAQVCVLSSSQCATTNAQGNYSIPNVPAGNQTVRASAGGYTTLQQAVTVPAGGTATANFSLVASSVPRTITHSQSQTIVADNSVACVNAAAQHTDNAYLREFTLTNFAINGPFAVSSVEFGVELAQAGSGSSQPIEVWLYRKTNPAGPLTYGNLTTIATASVNIPNQSLSRYTVPIAGTAPAGSVLVVELYTPNGQGSGHMFFIGSNESGQTGPSYLAAPDCDIDEPTDIANIGFPNMHIVMNVTGVTTTAAPEAGLDGGSAAGPVRVTLSTEASGGKNQLGRHSGGR